MRRAPVTEYDEQQELEAARERNDLEVSDLREMSVAELRQVSRDLELDAVTGERKDNLVDEILLCRPTARRPPTTTRPASSTSWLRPSGFLRRHGLPPSPEDVYVSSSQVRGSACASGTASRCWCARHAKPRSTGGCSGSVPVNGVDTETARRRPASAT